MNNPGTGAEKSVEAASISFKIHLKPEVSQVIKDIGQRIKSKRSPTYSAIDCALS